MSAKKSEPWEIFEGFNFLKLEEYLRLQGKKPKTQGENLRFRRNPKRGLPKIGRKKAWLKAWCTWEGCDILSVWLCQHGGVEDVDQHQKQCDQEGHAPGNGVHRHQETYPRNADEHSWGQVAVDQILSWVPLKGNLKSCQREVSKSWKFITNKSIFVLSWLFETYIQFR